MSSTRPLYALGTPARLAVFTTIVAAPLVALATCGPDTEPVAAMLDDRCGQPEPTQLLGLASNQVVPFDKDAVVAHGDRWLVAIDTLDGAFEGMPPHPGQIESSRVVSVDRCGDGSPVLIADGIDRVFAPAQEGLPWLGCSDVTHEMFTIDPNGIGDPLSLGVVPLCRFEQSPGHIWIQSRLDDREQIIALRAQPGVGYERWTVTDRALPGAISVAVADDRLWYVDDQRRLIEVDIESPADSVQLSEDVSAVTVAANSRFLAWGTESSVATPGRWTIYDRESGEEVPVVSAGERDVQIRLARFSFIFEVALEDGTSRFTQYRLPSLETFTFHGDWGTLLDTGAGDLMLQSRQPEEGLYRWAVGAQEPQMLYDGTVITFRIDDDEVLLWDYYDYDSGLGVDQEIHSRLVRIPLGDLQPEIVVDDVYQPLGFDDGRWLQVRGWSGDGQGELRVIDPVEGTEQVIDEDVAVWFARHNADANPVPGVDILPSDAEFVYSVHDGSERSGLWSAALAGKE